MNSREMGSSLGAQREELLRTASARLPTRADAEDVVHAVLAQALAGASKLEDAGALRGWLRVILRNAIADFYRARRRAAAADLPEAPAEVAPVRHDDSACTCAATLLGGLRPAYADAVRRVDVEAQPIANAARDLGVTQAHLHVRLHRARRALRDRVAVHCGVTRLAPCLRCTCDVGRPCGAG